MGEVLSLSLSVPLREKTGVFLNADSENFISRFPFVIIKTLLTVVIRLPATCVTSQTPISFNSCLDLFQLKYSVRRMADLKS